MLELASLNHPLMKQLMLRAPGTYHHSVIVGTLAEAACEAIGANGLQAKIAAYFHDIGKALKPRYFVENQRGGVNRHNELSPEQSAAIIISHVTEGARMAREHKLPQPIIDNILMHHGTGILQYFFAKAKLEATDPSRVDEAVYRYPGPKPNTREAGVIMLSDKVEAATRTIKNPTEANVRAMINRIVNSVMADDQFSDCPMTFREIYTVADTFVTVLMGIYHQRIEYPQTAGISQAAPMPQPDRAALPPAGTITLDLDRPAAAALRAGAPAFDEEDVTDETNDYESLRNLPQGE
jgi:putative nucleotidyltransferase with HDIG domain